MSSSFVIDPTMQAAMSALDGLSQRQNAISRNLANVDTPGYHTKDINFQAAIQRVMNEGNDVRLENVSSEVEGLPERPDGNNVNIDRESMLMAQTQLQYQMGVQLIKAEFHRLLTAIKDGN